MTSNDFESGIKRIALAFVSFLNAKNKRYGNSVNNPIRIFSKADTTEQIYVRIDDKLSRLKEGQIRDTDRIPTIIDLVGYLLILLNNYMVCGLFDPAGLEDYGKMKGVSDEKEEGEAEVTINKEARESTYSTEGGQHPWRR